MMDKKGGVIPKKIVVLLVLIAFILAVVAVTFHFVSSGEKVAKNSGLQTSTGAKVGVTIIPQDVEDKGLEGGALNG